MCLEKDLKNIAFSLPFLHIVSISRPTSGGVGVAFSSYGDSACNLRRATYTVSPHCELTLPSHTVSPHCAHTAKSHWAHTGLTKRCNLRQLTVKLTCRKLRRPSHIRRPICVCTAALAAGSAEWADPCTRGVCSRGLAWAGRPVSAFTTRDGRWE